MSYFLLDWNCLPPAVRHTDEETWNRFYYREYPGDDPSLVASGRINASTLYYEELRQPVNPSELLGPPDDPNDYRDLRSARYCVSTYHPLPRGDPIQWLFGRFSRELFQSDQKNAFRNELKTIRKKVKVQLTSDFHGNTTLFPPFRLHLRMYVPNTEHNLQLSWLRRNTFNEGLLAYKKTCIAFSHWLYEDVKSFTIPEFRRIR